jgi:phosphoglycolate phosphatase-like HAD superfamily hydrolase
MFLEKNKYNITLILDFDGVIVNSVDKLRQIYGDVIRKQNIFITSDDFDYLDGKDINYIEKHIKENYSVKKSISFKKIFDKKYMSLYNKVKLMDGIKDVIKLANKNNWKLVINSAAKKKYITLVLNRYKLSKYFSYIQAGKTKHSPISYLNIKNKINSSYYIVIDDNDKSILSAQKADCLTLYFSDKNIKVGDGQFHSMNELLIKLLELSSQQKLQFSFLTSDINLQLSPMKCNDVDEKQWNKLKREKKYVYDGPVILVHNFKVNNKKISLGCCPSTYKYFLLGQQKNWLSVAVQGILQNKKGQYLIGKRSEKVINEPNKWEFVPSGALSKIDMTFAEEQLKTELLEETNNEIPKNDSITWFAITVSERTLDLCGFFKKKYNLTPCPTEEYQFFDWVSLKKLPKNIDWTEASNLIIPLLNLQSKRIRK